MNNISFLIIQNDEFKNTLIEQSLRSLGYMNIKTFECITSSFSWLKENNGVDIIICDIEMKNASLIFLKKISTAFHIGGLALYSNIDLDLRQSIAKMIEMFGIKYLCDLRAFDLNKSLISMIDNFKSNKISRKLEKNTKYIISDTDIELFVDNSNFIGFYQPQFNLHTKSIYSAEVLLRLKHPTFGVLSPNLFIHRLIKLNLIDKVFFNIFTNGLALQQHFSFKHNIEFSLSYNLDIKQLESPEFVKKIIYLVEKSKILPSNIIFEITEMNISSKKAYVLKNLLRLRFAGFNLSIDDFGTEHSSIMRLCELPFTQLKIDPSFIQKMMIETKYQAVIESIIHLSNSLDMQVIAEGIETLEQFNFLRKIGCIYGQGYYFSKPLDESNFINLLIENKSVFKKAI